MKTLSCSVALILIAGPALAQTAPQPVSAAPRPVAAAATIPNTFDGPAAAPTPAAPLPPPAGAQAGQAGPDVKRAEDALRAVVAGFQGDSLDYAMFSQDLGGRIQGQATTIGPIIKGFGALNTVAYVGQEQGAELFALDFANARTQWIIGFNAEDEIALLLFRPAPAETAATAAPAGAPSPTP